MKQITVYAIQTHAEKRFPTTAVSCSAVDTALTAGLLCLNEIKSPYSRWDIEHCALLKQYLEGLSCYHRQPWGCRASWCMLGNSEQVCLSVPDTRNRLKTSILGSINYRPNGNCRLWFKDTLPPSGGLFSQQLSMEGLARHALEDS